MKKNFTEIEIPFGVKDSELYQFTYTIPDGYSAEIKDGKVIVKKKESEDERIRKELIEYLTHRAEVTGFIDEDKDCKRWIAYLEKQKGKRGLDFAEGKVEGARQTCQEIKDAMSLFEPKDLTPFEFTFRDYIDSAIRYCLAGEGYQQNIKEWAADLLNLEKQKEQKPNVELVQKSWYLEGYHDGKYNNEPKWLIQTGEGGPRYEENPKYGTQKPAEWSEEDREMSLSTRCSVYEYEEVEEWLNSIRPQPHWKPSEEQMEWLESAVRLSTDKPHIHGIIISLYEQLKRL